MKSVCICVYVGGGGGGGVTVLRIDVMTEKQVDPGSSVYITGRYFEAELDGCSGQMGCSNVLNPFMLRAQFEKCCLHLCYI